MPHPTLIYPQNRRASRATASSRPHLRRHPRPSPFAHILPSKTAHDGNGNVRALVKADAANPVTSGFVERYAYDGFGRELPLGASMPRHLDASGSPLNAFRFSTKQLDAETGMNYYGYRFYAADAGRWINRDPLLERGGIGLYQFNFNNAIAHVDKDGRISVHVVVAIVGVGCLVAASVVTAAVIMNGCEPGDTKPIDNNYLCWRPCKACAANGVQGKVWELVPYKMTYTCKDNWWPIPNEWVLSSDLGAKLNGSPCPGS